MKVKHCKKFILQSFQFLTTEITNIFPNNRVLKKKIQAETFK